MPVRRDHLYNAVAAIFLVGSSLLFLPAGALDAWRKTAAPAELASAAATPAEAVAPFRFPAAASRPYDMRQKALAALGRALFFDARLSANGRVSCATCHAPERAFTDWRALPQGVSQGARHTPTLVNAFAQSWFFWDGRAENLAQQALGPLEDPAEHGFTRVGLVRAVTTAHRAAFEASFGPLPREAEAWLADAPAVARRHAGTVGKNAASYAVISWADAMGQHRLMAEAFRLRLSPQAMLLRRLGLEDETAPPAPTVDPAARFVQETTAQGLYAIAAFVAAQRSLTSPFDRFAARLADGQDLDQAMGDGFGAEAWRGFQLFTGKARCSTCHNGPNFSDQEFHNVGVPDDRKPWPDLGRAAALRRMDPSPAGCGQDAIRRAEAAFGLGIVTEACRELPYVTVDDTEAVGAFKTPTLRHVTETAPYMHNGHYADLRAVIDHYDRLADAPTVGHRTEALTPLGLTTAEKDDLIAFLKTLSGPIVDVSAESAAASP